ncbi:hypothetical protein EBESD8_11970 [Rhodococcus aetherivorans]|nr:hypothetical protein EBESD8_11970 [Rhodococcus aetherivorans]
MTRELAESATSWLLLPTGSNRDDLKAALKQVVADYVRHRHMLAAVTEAASYDPRVRDAYRFVMEDRIDYMRERFRIQQKSGTIPANIDISTVTPWIAWMIERGLYQLLGHDALVRAKDLDGMTTVVWRTLYEQP